MCYTAEWTPASLKTMTTPDRVSLSEEIASWDGKSAAALQSTYERHCAEEYFVATILAHVADVALQRAATWLLKKHLETGHSLGAAGCRAIFGALPVLEHWESRLHILQCVSCLDVPEDESAGLETFLDACLESDNKFVRAWAYNGFNELSLRFPRYREKVDGMLACASVSEAASVRARIRNMTKRR
ncbi:MAG: hypothetical protein OXU19_04640 [bacterium]|nr:hypothetical protein [bacterium]